MFRMDREETKRSIEETVCKLFDFGSSPIRIKVNSGEQIIYMVAYGEFTSKDIENIEFTRNYLILKNRRNRK